MEKKKKNYRRNYCLAQKISSIRLGPLHDLADLSVRKKTVKSSEHHQGLKGAKTTTELCPPKPNELEIAASTYKQQFNCKLEINYHLL